MNEEMIEITRKEYNKLLEAQAWLRSLNTAGVDNWEGYGYAWEIFEEDFPEYCNQ